MKAAGIDDAGRSSEREGRPGGASGPVVALLEELLAATEEIRAGALGETALERLVEAHARRDRAYHALVAGVDPARFVPCDRARTLLAQIRELDAELIRLGERLPRALRGRRHALQRRRSALQAHAARERDEPRVVTLKA